jgi:hypothetical protein
MFSCDPHGGAVPRWGEALTTSSVAEGEWAYLIEQLRLS